MRVKGILTVLMAALMIMCLPFTVAQGETDVPVVAGETSTVAMESITMDATPSTELGGLKGQITQTDTVQRWVDIGGEHAYFIEDVVVTDVQDFTMYMFPAFATIDPEVLLEGSSYKLSENIDLGNGFNIWETFLSQSYLGPAPDGQTPLDLTTENMLYIGGLRWDAQDGEGPLAIGVVGRMREEGTAILVDTTIKDCTTDGVGICATAAELETAFTGTWTDLRYMSDTMPATTPFTATMMVGEQDGVFKILADIDRDGVFELADVVTNGYQVDAFNGDALALIPGGSYDIYGLY